jgi:hypothetical protein
VEQVERERERARRSVLLSPTSTTERGAAERERPAFFSPPFFAAPAKLEKRSFV